MWFTIKQAKELVADIKKEFIINCTIISCASKQDWSVLFDRPFTYIDVLKMTYRELFGTDCGDFASSESSSFFQPTWHKNLLETKTLVIDNFAEIPQYSKAEAYLKYKIPFTFNDIPGQTDYAFMCLNPHENTPFRVLNSDSPYKVEEDVAIYIIHRYSARHRIWEYIKRRAKVIDISKQVIGETSKIAYEGNISCPDCGNEFKIDSQPFIDSWFYNKDELVPEDCTDNETIIFECKQCKNYMAIYGEVYGYPNGSEEFKRIKNKLVIRTTNDKWVTAYQKPVTLNPITGEALKRISDNVGLTEAIAKLKRGGDNE